VKVQERYGRTSVPAWSFCCRTAGRRLGPCWRAAC